MVSCLVFYFLDCYLGYSKVKWWKAIGAFATGAASGFLAATGVTLLGQVIGNVVFSLAGLIFNATPITATNLMIEVFTAIIIGIAAGLAGGAGLGQTKYLNSQSRQFLKRVAREPAKSIAYFIKSNKTIYNRFFYSLERAIMAAAVTKYGKTIIVRE